MTSEPQTVTVQTREGYTFTTDHITPDVEIGHTNDGRVALLASPQAAQTLARIIARYGTYGPRIVDAAGTGILDMEFAPDTWCGITVDLLAAGAMAGDLPAPAYVDLVAQGITAPVLRALS